MRVFRILCVVMALILSHSYTISAQNELLPPTIYHQISTLSEKYKDEKGVKSFVATDGFRLQTVKMMLRKEFGKEFVDNIKAFAVIFYKDAKEEVVEQIVAEVEQIAASLQNVNIDAQLKPGAKGEGYVRLSANEQRLTDLLIVMNHPSPKLIYFWGDFEAGDIKYNNK